jgi:hypothetical protein
VIARASDDALRPFSHREAATFWGLVDIRLQGESETVFFAI